MPAGHPERLTGSLPEAHEMWLTELRRILWPAGEYLSIIDGSGPPAGV